MLNLTGFKGKASNKELKDVGEDIKDGKITYPLVRALPKLDRQARERIWNTVASKPQDQEIVNGVINTLREVCPPPPSKEYYLYKTKKITDI